MQIYLFSKFIFVVVVIHVTHAFLWSSQSNKENINQTSTSKPQHLYKSDKVGDDKTISTDESIVGDDIDVNDGEFSFYNFLFGAGEKSTHDAKTTQLPTKSEATTLRSSSTVHYFTNAALEAEHAFKSVTDRSSQQHSIKSTPTSSIPTTNSRTHHKSKQSLRLKKPAAFRHKSISSGKLERKKAASKDTLFVSNLQDLFSLLNSYNYFSNTEDTKEQSRRDRPSGKTLSTNDKAEAVDIQNMKNSSVKSVSQGIEHQIQSVKHFNESSKNDNVKNSCKTCGRGGNHNNNQIQGGLSEVQTRKIRTSMVGNLIMQKLRINPAKQTKSGQLGNKLRRVRVPNLPRAVMDQAIKDTFEEEEENFYAKNEEAIIPGIDLAKGDCISLRTTGCYHFQFKDLIHSEVASAKLWMYKTPDRRDIHGQTFKVFELERRGARNNFHRRSLIARRHYRMKEGWVSIDFTNIVQRWFDEKRKGETLAISCPTCHTNSHQTVFGEKEGYKPVLVVQFVDQEKLRPKRSVDSCDATSTCCKRSLTVNFEDVNINSILFPHNLSVGYCYGWCDGEMSFTNNHTTIKQSYRFSEFASSDLIEELKPCCVPISYKDADVLTIHEGNIVRKRIPKVIVDRCGCV